MFVQDLMVKLLLDGLSNTNALYSANPTNNLAVKYCKSLTTGGYNDWYLPAKDELELCYRSFKPTTQRNGAYAYNNQSSVPVYNSVYSTISTVFDGITYPTGYPRQTNISVFKSGGSERISIDGTGITWSSNEISNTLAWSCNFDSGAGGYNGQRSTRNNSVRPVRRSLL